MTWIFSAEKTHLVGIFYGELFSPVRMLWIIPHLYCFYPEKVQPIYSFIPAPTGPTVRERGLFQAAIRVKLQIECWKRCRRAFFGKSGVGRLLWKIKNHLSKILKARKLSVLGEKQGQTQAKTTRSSLKYALHALQCPPRNPTLDLLASDGEDPPFCRRDIKQIQLSENNGGRWKASESHTNSSCTINTVTENQKKSAPSIIPEEKFQKQHFAREEGE